VNELIICTTARKQRKAALDLLYNY